VNFEQRQTTTSSDLPLRWGILGTGTIAADFATDIALLNDATVAAVGSRSQAAADAFSERFAIPHQHGSYDALVRDPDVDVVYVATPHVAHYENAMLAISGGKNVLVEKPFTINARQAKDLVAAARKSGVFLMEAMWMRFLPHVVEIRELLAARVLGQVRTVTADLGTRFPHDAESRIFAPALGAGALLDMGVYPVSFAWMVLGAPTGITAVSDQTFTGVDAQTSIILQYADGSHAVLTTTLEAEGAGRATILGTDARIEIDRIFHRPSSFSLIYPDGRTNRHEHTPVGNGLRYEAIEVARCIRAGLSESPAMPLDESVQIMETLDEIRRQIGLIYPGEQHAE